MSQYSAYQNILENYMNLLRTNICKRYLCNIINWYSFNRYISRPRSDKIFFQGNYPIGQFEIFDHAILISHI